MFPAIYFRRPTPVLSASGVMQPGKLETGIDFIPNMNARLTIKAPFQKDRDLKASLSAAGISDEKLPPSFSWTKPEEVKKHRGLSDFSGDWIMQAPDQSGCGSCWAVSATSVLTDRYSIAMKKKMPILSAVVTASCATSDGHDGCQGDWPSDAGCFFEQVGVPVDACWPYAKFCSSQTCNTSGDYACCDDFKKKSQRASISGDDVGQKENCVDFSSRVGTSCGSGPGNTEKCQVSGADTKRYKAVTGSTVSLASGTKADCIRRMKANIFAGGPIVSCFWVYGDFTFPTAVKQWGWKETSGVYVHQDPSPYINDPYVAELWNNRTKKEYEVVVDYLNKNSVDLGQTLAEFKQNLNQYLQKKEGGHAITVVGWSQGKVGKFGDKVDYWVCRNSWGTKWNENGLFRFAMSDSSRNINVDVNLEQLTDQGKILGGGTSFNVPTSTSSGGLQSGYHPLSGDVNKPKWLWILGIVGGLLVILGLLAFWKHRKNQQLQQPPQQFRYA
jgi:hypothetical protein